MEELKNTNEVNIRPVTPSKIPVGRYRVEMEKDINRAMFGGTNGNGTDSNRTSRSTSPETKVSRIPQGNWRNKVTAYKNLMERQEKKAMSDSLDRNKRQYFKLNSQNGISSNNNVTNYAYKVNGRVKMQNGGNIPSLSSSNGIGHVGLMANPPHARAGGLGSKRPSR